MNAPAAAAVSHGSANVGAAGAVLTGGRLGADDDMSLSATPRTAERMPLATHEAGRAHFAGKEALASVAERSDVASLDGRRSADAIAPGARPADGTAPDDGDIPPFPTKAIAIIALSLLSNALYVTTLFPFLPFLTADLTHLTDEKQIGYRAGYIAGAFMIGRLFSSTLWGIWSDRYGRKPVLFLGCMTISITSLAFGFSFSYWWAILIRFLGGVGNGITAAAKVCTAEVAHDKHQAKAMGVVSGSWAAGLVLGPAIGGLTSRPHESSLAFMRALAPDGSLFHTYPYLLPNIVLAAVGVGAAISLRGLKETLKRKSDMQAGGEDGRGAGAAQHGTGAQTNHASSVVSGITRKFAAGRAQRQGYEHVGGDAQDGDVGAGFEADRSRTGSGAARDDGTSRVGGSGDVEMVAVAAASEPRRTSDSEAGSVGRRRARSYSSLSVAPEPAATNPYGLTLEQFDRPIFLQATVMKLVIGYTLLSLYQIAFDEAFPLWAVIPAEKGGLGFDETQIGTVMTIMGACLVIFQLFAFPWIAKKLGTVAAFAWAAVVAAPVMVLFPIVVLPRHFAVRFAFICVFQLLKNCTSVVSFTSLFILINNSVPSHRRGAVNGFAMLVASLGKAAAPALAGNLFAWTVSNGYGFPLDVHFLYLLCGFMSAVLAYIGFSLPAYATQSIDSILAGEEGNTELSTRTQRDAATGSRATTRSSNRNCDGGTPGDREGDDDLLANDSASDAGSAVVGTDDRV